MRDIRRPLLVLAALTLAACARMTPTQRIAQLESDRARSPERFETLRDLGVLYYKADRPADARSVLAEAARIRPNDGVTALYLGLSAEAMDDVTAARAAYANYLRVGRTARVRGQLEARMAALQRREIEAQARAAVANEQQLAGRPGNARTLAVLPFHFTGPDTSLRPLERGFAELVTTDLSRVSALTVVERARLQAVLDEIRAGTSGAIDPATSARAGRLIQAGTLVGGTLLQTGQQLRADAQFVPVVSGARSGGASETQTLDQLFDLEKALVLELIDSLGVQITTAERNAIEQRPTRSIAAFLAYSRGLEFEDRGQYDDASRMFQDAARLDPGFGAAQQKGQENRNAAAGNQVTTASVEASLAGSAEGAVVSAATQSVASGLMTGTAAAAAGDLNPSVVSAATSGVGVSVGAQPQKDPGAGTGGDNPTTQIGRVVIVIKPPLP